MQALTGAGQYLKVTGNPVALTPLQASQTSSWSVVCCLFRRQHSLTFSIAHSSSMNGCVCGTGFGGSCVGQTGRLTLPVNQAELGLQLRVGAFPVSFLGQSHVGLTLCVGAMEGCPTLAWIT